MDSIYRKCPTIVSCMKTIPIHILMAAYVTLKVCCSKCWDDRWGIRRVVWFIYVL